MIVKGSELRGRQRVEADVVVVGSGAGGAVVAFELAELGLDVVVIEEGPHIPHDEYAKLRPTQVMRRLGRSAGTAAAIGFRNTPTISILAGRCVGGSSVFTGAVCFRVPEAVHAGWVQDLGVEALGAEAMRDCYERVERAVHVETVPVEMRSRSTTLFAEGATRLGYELAPLRRNTKDCCGCSRCNFGCPHGAKQSVDLTYLPRAFELGARLFCEHRVDRVLTEGGRATGVAGRVLNRGDGKAGDRFEVRAKTVVLAAGSIHTPVILKKSGVGRLSGQVGRNLTLHPAFRLGAIFDEPVFAWKGALQSAWTDHFEHDGITLVSALAPVSMLCAGVPGVGPEYMARVRQMTHLATFGGMIHDGPNGRVRRGLGREPLVTYRMPNGERLSLLKAMEIVGETYFEAGAKTLFVPIFGSPPLGSVDELRGLLRGKLSAARIECLSFHPLGTARMGVDPRRSVVDVTGESHEAKGLWVADGSVFPTSVGVNTQMPIMAMATRIAREIGEQVGQGRPV